MDPDYRLATVGTAWLQRAIDRGQPERNRDLRGSGFHEMVWPRDISDAELHARPVRDDDPDSAETDLDPESDLHPETELPRES